MMTEDDMKKYEELSVEEMMLTITSSTLKKKANELNKKRVEIEEQFDIPPRELILEDYEGENDEGEDEEDDEGEVPDEIKRALEMLEQEIEILDKVFDIQVRMDEILNEKIKLLNKIISIH